MHLDAELESFIMAVKASSLGQLPEPRCRSGRPPTLRPLSWWQHLLGGIDELNRVVEVVAIVERAGPYRSAAVARRWLETQ